ncbi:velvet factor-domain-containing protein [Dichotomocladium elegans]|nr:velvet factor-domain-containing protein [Dichotomocladium elegans]
MEDSVLYHFATVKQTRHNREEIEYDLQLRQQPKRSRMCGVGEKADRRPIDPPPIVQLKVIDPNLPSSDQISFLQNPYYFMYASLMAADLDEELHLLRDGKTRSTTGSVVSSLYHLKDIDNSDAGFFVFPDLSVRVEGNYRLKLSLFEIIGKDVYHCRSIISNVFVVYSAKKFPGMEESTFLSRAFADQGLKIRIRKELRRQRRKNSRRKDSDEQNTVLDAEEDKSIKRIRNEEQGQEQGQQQQPHHTLPELMPSGRPAAQNSARPGTNERQVSLYRSSKYYVYPSSSPSKSYHTPEHAIMSVPPIPPAPAMYSQSRENSSEPRYPNQYDTRLDEKVQSQQSSPQQPPRHQQQHHMLNRTYSGEYMSTTDTPKANKHPYPVQRWDDTAVTADLNWRRTGEDRVYGYNGTVNRGSSGNNTIATATVTDLSDKIPTHTVVTGDPHDRKEDTTTTTTTTAAAAVVAADGQPKDLYVYSHSSRCPISSDPFYHTTSTTTTQFTRHVEISTGSTVAGSYPTLHPPLLVPNDRLSLLSPSSSSSPAVHAKVATVPTHQSRSPAHGFVEKPQPQRGSNINNLLTQMRIEQRESEARGMATWTERCTNERLEPQSNSNSSGD